MVTTLTPIEARRAMLMQFWRAGYYQTTVADLAAAAQLSRSQFYRQYHSKTVAARQCLQLYQDVLNQELTRLVAREKARQTPPAAIISACCLWPFQSDQWPRGCWMVDLLATLAPDQAPVLTAQLQALYADLQSRFVGWLAPQAAQLDAPLAEVAASLMQVRTGLQLLAKQDPSAAQLKQQATTSVNLILKGIA